MISEPKLLKCIALGTSLFPFCRAATVLAYVLCYHLPILWMMDHRVWLSESGWVSYPFMSVAYLPLVTEFSDDLSLTKTR